jgi:hypothetical protein
MNRIGCAIALLLAASFARAASPGNAPQLPITGTRIVNVATEAQLQTAMGNLQNGDTLLLTNGTYNLSSTLYINGRHNVTIRGLNGSTNVVLVGKGMDNTNYGNVLLGIWSNSTNTTIAHLTIRDTYDNEIIFNPGAQSPHVYCVRLLNAGSQFIKVNPTDIAAGIGVSNGVVEYCWFEYTGSPPNDHGAGGGAGYFNGISAHAARNWIIRGNLFKNLHNPDTAGYLWNPSVLFWNHSANTTTEQNTFINSDRAIAYGLQNTAAYPDHSAGLILNNFVYMTPGLFSASRRADSDGAIIAWDSPGTQIDHNTVVLNTNEFYAIEFRFPRTTSGAARNNLADSSIHLRDSATATLSGNLLNASAGLFVNPAAADLHLLWSATNAIDKAGLIAITNDFDGERRPRGAASDIGADEFSTNTPPVITNFLLSGSNAVVQFTTLLGMSYELQQASNLMNNSWSLVRSNPGTGGILQTTDTNATGQSRRFYRIRISP